MVLISIVTGTYNRRGRLQQMMKSVRQQMWPGLEYEFVIIDGGSTDGTLNELRQMSDVVLIEDGELKGAISAFTRAAHQAQGEFVILANDDIEFHDYSILRAVAYLQDHPSCGAVAFEDDRLARQGRRYGVQLHNARDAEGNNDPQPYAQVGMFRKWIGDVAGWWGADDAIMSQARTYGGDNYLSSRIWEMGYTIDQVDGCRVDDIITIDGLRKDNESRGAEDGRIFRERYPKGAVFGADPVPPREEPEVLRTLYLSLHEAGNQNSYRWKRGLRDALSILGPTLEYDYVGRDMRGHGVAVELIALCRAFRPHVIYTQIHDAPAFMLHAIHEIRSENPEIVAINWNGDYWPAKALSDNSLKYAELMDLNLLVNQTLVNQYQERGLHAAYVQDAAEDPDTVPDDVPEYDVLFIGNCYQGTRRQLGEILKSLPYKVGLYGLNWTKNGKDISDGQTYYDWSKTHALIRKAKIVIGDMQFPDAEAYVSNRFFNTLHAGGFHLQQRIPGFKEATGITPGKHYVEFDTLEDLPKAVEYWMTHEKQRDKIAKTGMNYVRRYHSYKARVKQVFTKELPRLLDV